MYRWKFRPYYIISIICTTLYSVPINIISNMNSPSPYQTTQSSSCIELQYISLRHQELQHCKHVGYDFYCKELFAAKHKSRYICEITIFLIYLKRSLKIVVLSTITITIIIIIITICWVFTITMHLSNIQCLMEVLKLF